MILILATFGMGDVRDFFNPKPYAKVSKGSHTHYVPEGRDPNVPISRSSKRLRRLNEKITPKDTLLITEF